MPKRFERHARSAWEWGTPGSRRDDLARAVTEQGIPEVAPEGRRPPGKKDPSLCKAVHWKGPHQPVLRMRQFGWRRAVSRKWAISWRSRDGEPSWHCAHEEFCSGCSKILRTGINAGECPAFHPITDAEREAIEAERAEDEARAAAVRARSRRQPKPPVTKGFRRRRD